MGRVHIITGEIAAGKTATMLKHYQAKRPGTADGFVSIKVFSEDSVLEGYDLMRLATGETMPFIRLRGYQTPQPDSFTFDRFIFRKKPLEIAGEVLRALSSAPAIQTIFLDEIGPVELQGSGFCQGLQELLASDKELFLCVNRRNLEQVTKKFGITFYDLFEVQAQTP